MKDKPFDPFLDMLSFFSIGGKYPVGEEGRDRLHPHGATVQLHDFPWHVTPFQEGLLFNALRLSIR